MTMGAIDYRQVRIDAAINVMNAILSSSLMTFLLEYVFRKEVSKLAVEYADDLVAELQKRDTVN